METFFGECLLGIAALSLLLRREVRDLHMKSQLLGSFRRDEADSRSIGQ